MSAATIKAALAGAAPLTAAERQFAVDRISQLEREVADLQLLAWAARVLASLPALIDNDSHAISCQSIGQYRTTLKQFISQSVKDATK